MFRRAKNSETVNIPPFIEYMALETLRAYGNVSASSGDSLDVSLMIAIHASFHDGVVFSLTSPIEAKRAVDTYFNANSTRQTILIYSYETVEAGIAEEFVEPYNAGGISSIEPFTLFDHFHKYLTELGDSPQAAVVKIQRAGDYCSAASASGCVLGSEFARIGRAVIEHHLSKGTKLTFDDLASVIRRRQRDYEKRYKISV